MFINNPVLHEKTMKAGPGPPMDLECEGARHGAV